MWQIPTIREPLLLLLTMQQLQLLQHPAMLHTAWPHQQQQQVQWLPWPPRYHLALRY
jgi:hypothetical protein